MTAGQNVELLRKPIPTATVTVTAALGTTGTIDLLKHSSASFRCLGATLGSVDVYRSNEPDGTYTQSATAGNRTLNFNSTSQWVDFPTGELFFFNARYLRFVAASGAHQIQVDGKG